MIKIKTTLKYIKYYTIFIVRKILFHISIFIDFRNYPETKFCFLIASYNNENFCIQNLMSVEKQKYKNFRVIYIDDCSTDQTKYKVKKFLEDSLLKNKTLIIECKKRKGSLENKYHAIHNHILDNEVIVSLDGDDFLSNKYVLTYLNKIYSSKDTLMTYGNYSLMSGKIHFQKKYSNNCIKNNSFRETNHPSHLRTYYAWIFKKISIDNFLNENEDFFQTGEDKATMYPIIEMCGPRHKFIPYDLLRYNDLNPIGLHNLDVLSQLKYENKRVIKNKKKLRPIQTS